MRAVHKEEVRMAVADKPVVECIDGLQE